MFKKAQQPRKKVIDLDSEFSVPTTPAKPDFVGPPTPSADSTPYLGEADKKYHEELSRRRETAAPTSNKSVSPTQQRSPAIPSLDSVIALQISLHSIINDLAKLPNLRSLFEKSKENIENPELANKTKSLIGNNFNANMIDQINNAGTINNGKFKADGRWGQRTQDAINSVAQFLNSLFALAKGSNIKVPDFSQNHLDILNKYVAAKSTDIKDKDSAAKAIDDVLDDVPKLVSTVEDAIQNDRLSVRVPTKEEAEQANKSLQQNPLGKATEELKPGSSNQEAAKAIDNLRTAIPFEDNSLINLEKIVDFAGKLDLFIENNKDLADQNLPYTKSNVIENIEALKQYIAAWKAVVNPSSTKTGGNQILTQVPFDYHNTINNMHLFMQYFNQPNAPDAAIAASGTLSSIISATLNILSSLLSSPFGAQFGKELLQGQISLAQKYRNGLDNLQRQINLNKK